MIIIYITVLVSSTLRLYLRGNPENIACNQQLHFVTDNHVNRMQYCCNLPHVTYTIPCQIHEPNTYRIQLELITSSDPTSIITKPVFLFNHSNTLVHLKAAVFKIHIHFPRLHS